MNVSFTVITSSRGLLTKTIQPNGKGGIVKAPAAQMTAGIAQTVIMPFANFGWVLRTLKPNQAIAHGVTGFDMISIVSESKFTGQPNTITRSKKHFNYTEGWGLGMIDHDPKPGQAAMSTEQVIEAISSAWPAFRSLPKWWTPSTSSCIYDTSGNQLTGEGNGFHLYFPFSPASKLPELADVLFKRMWLAGNGYIFISRAGSMLERTIFDASVFSPERLDFVSGAKCIACEQRLPEPVFIPAEMEVAA